MNRRLYFLFPERLHAERIADELTRLVMDSHQIQVIVRNPGAALHSNDRLRLRLRLTGHRLERLVWNGNLALFFLALLWIPIFATVGWFAAVWVMLVLMLVSFVFGGHASRLPGVQLDDFAEALNHGEALLVVDVSRRRFAEIEHAIQRAHPEAAWTLGGSHARAV